MTILIKGMEMPKSCNACQMLEGYNDDGLCHAASRWLDDDKYWLWYQYPEGDIDDSKPANCPLIEVPTPHGRLIDADALNNEYYKSPSFLNLCYAINAAPTIIEAEEGEG